MQSRPLNQFSISEHVHAATKLSHIADTSVVHYPVAMTEADAERFRKEAEECRKLAERSVSQLDKESWLHRRERRRK